MIHSCTILVGVSHKLFHSRNRYGFRVDMDGHQPEGMDPARTAILDKPKS